jgi:argininosuccinate lyase
MPFAPDYVRLVLADNFEDAKALLLEPLLSIHYAHLVMLVSCGIVSREDAGRIRRALDGISLDEVRGATYDGSCEDLFYYVDRLLAGACGEEVAGRLHTARSRNDIDMTMYRMRLRGLVLALLDATVALRRSLLDIVGRHGDSVFAAHTHTQPAQPTTVAHYLLGFVEELERDAVRLRAAYATVNRNPLGACAITGTGFPIDRDHTSRLLGFDGPTGNTYGSIATADYVLESLSAAAVTLVGLGRLLQDLLLWCTAEFGYLRLPDGYVQGSSIMPQKRNPVALEHARSLASKALGQALAAFTALHNTPFGDIVDTEDDFQPLVHAAFRDATRAVALTAASLQGADVDRARMEARAAEHWVTLTELADTLVRDHGLPFRASHAVAAQLAAALSASPGRPPSEVLAEVSKAVTGRAIRYSAGALAEVLSPRHFVRVRRTHGGPAPEETARASRSAAEACVQDAAWRAAVSEALGRAARALREAAGAL